MLTCRELIEFLDDYVADALPDAVRRDFEVHLKLCAACRRYLKTYRRTIDLERRALGDVQAQDCDDMPEDLVRAIVAAAGSTRTQDKD